MFAVFVVFYYVVISSISLKMKSFMTDLESVAKLNQHFIRVSYDPSYQICFKEVTYFYWDNVPYLQGLYTKTDLI